MSKAGEIQGAEHSTAEVGHSIFMSTRDVTEECKLDYWQYVVRDLIGGFELSEYNLSNFEASFSLKKFGDIKIGHYYGCSQAMRRTSPLINSGDNDDFIVVLQSAKTFNLDHAGHSRSGRGGLVLLDNARPYYGGHPDGLDIVNFFIPRVVLEQALKPVRLATGFALEETMPSFPVVASFLRSLHQHGDTLNASNVARMSSIAVDLLATGFADRFDNHSGRRSSNASTIFRAQSYIAAHIGDIGLDMKTIAASLPMSVRYLQEICSEEGISLSDWMWERRLLRAREKLANPANRSSSIGTISYECGFTSQAHFSKRFKRRFGTSPIEFRALSCSG